METAPGGVPSAPRISLTKCLWLCLPALLIGAILRLSLIAAVPEAYYGADSNSYFGTTKELILKGKFKLESKRRYLYPLMLIPTPFVPASTMPQVVAILQHAVGLGVIFGIGWVTANVVRRPALWVPPVTVLAAIWPRMLWYEHEVIAEAMMLAAFVWAVALGVPVGVLHHRKRLFWFLFAALIMIAIKPHGRPFWLALVLVAALVTRNPFTWGWKSYAVLALSAVVLLTGGSGSQGSWLFLNSSLPFVKTEGKYPEYRAILRPWIEKARADLPNYAFRQSQYKKMLSSHDPNGPLGPEWAALAKDDEKYSKVAGGFAKEAVLSNPVGYANLVFMKVMLALSDDNPGWKMIPQEFWRQQTGNDIARWAKKPEEMRIVYELPDEASYLRMVEERVRRKLWFEEHLKWFTEHFVWTKTKPGDPGEKPLVKVMPLGWMALFGLLTCFLPGRFVATSILWLPAILYLGLVFAVGDAVTRYLQPVEWILFIFIALGFDAILNLFARLFARPHAGSDDPAPAAPAAAA